MKEDTRAKHEAYIEELKSALKDKSEVLRELTKELLKVCAANRRLREEADGIKLVLEELRKDYNNLLLKVDNQKLGNIKKGESTYSSGVKKDLRNNVRVERTETRTETIAGLSDGSLFMVHDAPLLRELLFNLSQRGGVRKVIYPGADLSILIDL